MYNGALERAQNSRPYSNSQEYGTPGSSNPRGKRDTGYGAQNQVFEHGKVIIMPPPGKAPPNSPQPGYPGGGARPEDNPYIAAMAPEGTVPIAILPPFNRSPDYPTRCVIFSQLTDFEEAHIQDYGNIQVTSKPTYSHPRVARQANETQETLRFKRQINFANLFGHRTPKKVRGHSAPSSVSSYGPPSYSPPSYAPPTEPPVRIIYRKFGYVCEHTVSIDVCELPDYGKPQYGKPQESGQYGQQVQVPKRNKNGYERADVCSAGNSNRYGYENYKAANRANSLQSQGPTMCDSIQANQQACQGAQAQKRDYRGLNTDGRG